MARKTIQSANRRINGTCPHDCPDACGIVTEVNGEGLAVSVSAQEDHPVAQGWLCAKVAPYLERVYHGDRLTTPLRRKGKKGSGQWAPISWQQAIEEITDHWKNNIDQYGAESILPYSYSGTLGLVQMTVASARLWNKMGASRLERSICMAGTRHAVRATLGKRKSPPYHHVLDSNLLLLWGHNPVSTAPHLMPYIREASRNGCKVVVIDPHRSRSTRGTDLHLQPKPGSDGLLALGIARQIIEDNNHNIEWMQKNTVGWQSYLEHLNTISSAYVSEMTGISQTEIKQLAHWIATKSPYMIRLGDAINRQVQGGQTVRAIACLPTLTGQYGIRGGGLSCSTGDYFSWDDEAINHWAQCPPPGRDINMNRLGAALNGEAEGPPVQSLFVFCANPMVSAPNTSSVKKGLERTDLFTVVHDLFLTDTAQFADIVLPATSQLEHVDLHRGYGHTSIGYNHPAIDPIAEAKSNWQVMQLLASEMGYKDPWLIESADDVIHGIIEATRNRTIRLEGITLESLKLHGSLPYADNDEVPFSNLEFATASGKVELESRIYFESGLSAIPHWQEPIKQLAPSGYDYQDGLHLLSPAAHHFINSSLANLPTLKNREKDPIIIIHPQDANRLQLKDSAKVRVFNRRGSCTRRLKISEEILPGVATAVNGFWDKQDPSVTINWTTSDRLADVAGQSTFNTNRIWLELTL